MVDPKKIAWMQLIRSKNVGPVLFWELIRFYKDADHALACLPQLSLRGGRQAATCSKEEILREFEKHHQYGAEVIAAYEPDFPEILKQLPDCPPILSIKGKKEHLNKSSMAIVGARNASFSNCRFAQKLAADLGDRGWRIVSGMARGIDRAAHEGALPFGTIAVLAGGIDNIYPPENKNLYDLIADQGCLLTEMPFETSPTSAHFPRRNRLISGLSSGVVVVEAAAKSGSIITARFALEQNREIFAVPGSPLDPRCAGTNALIKQGANLIDSVEDIERILSPQTPLDLTPSSQMDYEIESQILDLSVSLDTLREQVWELLSQVPLSIDELIRHLNVSRGRLMLTLIELELAGRVTRHPQNTVVRVEVSQVA